MEKRLIIRCEGNAFDRGFSYGVQAKELIHDNIETYRQLLQLRFGLQWDEVRLQVGPFLPWIQELDAELDTELRAIAAGSETDLLDIILLNARSAFTLTRSVDECTAIAYTPPVADGGKTLLAQNWDNLQSLQAVVLRVIQPGKPEILTLTEAGTLAKIGLNSEGVGLCVNGLQAQGSAAKSIPIFILIRKALQAASLTEAMQVITDTPRDAPHNYMFVSRHGAAFTIEALTTAFDILAPSGKFLVHTNHFLSPRLAVRQEIKANSPNSVMRLWRAQQLLENYKDKFGVSEMKEVLSDHFDLPNSICRHAVTSGDDLQGETKCTVISEPAYGRMHVSQGNPCATPFDTFMFD